MLSRNIQSIVRKLQFKSKSNPRAVDIRHLPVGVTPHRMCGEARHMDELRTTKEFFADI